MVALALVAGLAAYTWWDLPALQNAARTAGLGASMLYQSAVTDLALPASAVADADESTATASASGPLVSWRPKEPLLLLRHIDPQDGIAPPGSTHSFRYDGRTYSVRADVPERLYCGAERAAKRLRGYPGQTQAEVNASVMRCLVFDPAQLPVLDALAGQLRRYRDAQNLSSDQYVELIAKYVQTLPYDEEKASSLAEVVTIRYPVQTAAEGKGVCGDKSALLAALLAHEGYNVAVLLFETEQHAAVGIVGIGESYRGTGYQFLETTQPAYVSEAPDSYAGGRTLTTTPQVIRIGSGKRAYTASNEVRRIEASRDEAIDRIELAPQELKGMAPWQWLAAKPRYDVLYSAVARLAWVKGVEDEQFLDRPAAVRWLDESAWWETAD